MYCNYCGKVIQDDANVCAYCGIRVGAVTARHRLVRPRVGRKVAGVCQGIANQFGWDVTLVRVVTALLGLFTFPIAILVYLLMWLIVPEEARTVPPVTTLNTTT